MGSPVTIPTSAQYPGVYTPGQVMPGTYNPYTGIGGGGNANIEGLYEGLGTQYYNEGQNFTNSQAGLTDQYLGQQGQYGDLTNQLFSPIWNGGGGYTPQQMANIQQTGAQQNIANELPNNFLTPDQQAAIAGNPYQAANTYQSLLPNINNLIAQNATGLDQAVAGGQTNADAAIQNMQQQYSSAINPSNLQVSPQFNQTINNELSTGASQLQAAQGNPALTPTAQYLQQAGMSNQQVQDTAEQAASAVGAQFQSTQDQLMQNQRAAGNATPMAVAAAQTALDRSSAASQADALTNATLQAQAAQRTAAQNIQNTQLNAGQYQAGLGSSNAIAEQNAGIAANTTAEQLRLAANQALTGYQTAAAQNIGTAGINEANTAATQAQNALQYEGNLATSNLSNQASNLANYQQNAEGTAANRALTLGTNQQATNQYNEGVQNTLQNEASSQAVNAYAPWVTQQNEGLAAAQNQEQYYGGQANTATSQGLQGTGMYMQGTMNAANGVAGRQQYDQSNSFGQNFTNSFGSALGKSLGTMGGGSNSSGQSYGYMGGEHGRFIDHHQLIEVGEHDRPEVILPLDPRTPPSEQNVWERMGAHLGDQMGIKKEGYATGGVIGGNDFTSDLMGLNMAEDPDRVEHYATGGIIMPHAPRTTIHMPHLSVPHVRMTTPSVHLNMPIRFPRISSPIRPAGLPGISTGYTAKDLGKPDPSGLPQYEQGGVLNTQAGQKNQYMMNMGRHNRPNPLPYSEMGRISRY